jgi:putative membrane protein
VSALPQQYRSLSRFERIRFPMAVDLILTILHHLLVFSLVAALAAELAAVRPNMNGEQIRHLGILDSAYGAIAGLIVVVGFGRVFFGAKGPDYFIANPIFWAKIGCFVLVGIISVPPTVRILGWRRNLRADPSFTAPPAEAKAVRRFMIAEALLIPFILIFAAMMVRG